MDDPDVKLARRARRGDRTALTSLYEKHRGPLFGFLLKETGSGPMAEDVFQETWVKVIRAMSRYDPDRGSFRAWLYRIATNTAVDRARREALRRGEELDAPVDGSDEARVSLMPANGPDPERASAGREAGRALGNALDSLRPSQRAAVLLRHQQGLSYPEISAALGVPEGTVKTQVHRAVQALRRSLKEWSDV